MHKSDESGFSAIEAILLLVIVAIIGFVGWYVWHAQNSSSKSLNAASNTNLTSPVKKSASTANSKTVVQDPTADWIAYTDSTGKFSLKYPSTWQKASHPELCNSGILLLGSTSDLVGKCGSEDFGEISVISIDGNKQNDYKFSSNSQISSIKTETAVVDGISGEKQSGVAKEDNSGGLGKYQAGTIVVQYLFYTNNKTYSVTYAQAPNSPIDLDNFNLLVSKTLKFN